MSVYNRIINAINSGGLSVQDQHRLAVFLNGKIRNQQIRKTDIAEDKTTLPYKCAHHSKDGKVHCPFCGAVAVKNGKKNGRQQYLCKSKKCQHRGFSATRGTFYYYSKLSDHQWEKFIELTLRGQSLRTISRDMCINIATAHFNRHKLMNMIEELDWEQDKFSGITEVDEYYTPLSFQGLQEKQFFIENGRMPNHHMSYEKRLEYVAQAGYDLDRIAEVRGLDHDDELPSNKKLSDKLNSLPSKQAMEVLTNLDKEQKKKRGISNRQVCILTCIDKLGNLYVSPACIGRIEPRHIEQLIGNRFGEDSIMVTDSLRAYKTFANGKSIHLWQIPSGKHTSGPFNLALINSLHSNLHSFFLPYREVASKYIDRYLAFFRWKEKNKEKTTDEQTKMLLDMLTEKGKGIRQRRYGHRKMPFDTKGVEMPKYY